MNCNTSGKCEDEPLLSLSKIDRLHCMEDCKKLLPVCQFSSYSEAKNQCLLLKTCYNFNKNESSFSSSKVSCDLPPGGFWFFWWHILFHLEITDRLFILWLLKAESTCLQQLWSIHIWPPMFWGYFWPTYLPTKNWIRVVYMMTNK